MPSSMQMQSISGIITQIHTTIGEVPPPLVGASVDIIDDKAYVFAGRLAESRKLTNYLYILDLHTLVWTRHIPPPDSESPPKVRYFHSTSIYNNQIVVFGGMSQSRISSNGLCVLDDIYIFDIETMCWKKPDIQPSLYSPQARYAHLASVMEDKLLIIGGQDLDNNYLYELNVLDLKSWEWEQVKTFEKHVGAYRSIAITAPPGTRIPTSTIKHNTEETDENDIINNNNCESSIIDDTRVSTIRPFGTSPLQSVDEVNPVYLYTNYNFTDVKRELQLIFPSTTPQLVIEDCSTYMNGSVMPPGLRFPTGHTLGNHLILAGTYLSPQSQSYTIWSLDLSKLTWSRIETGAVFSTGSWNRGALYEKTNRFIIFGNTNRALLDDYNHRQINFDHLALVDLEAFGIYALPKTTCSSLAQEMGLRLLNEPAVSDFNIITQDNITIPVNSAVLSQRWPYFANLIKENKETSHYMSFPYPHAVVIALLQFIYTDNLLTAQQYQPHILSQLLLLSDMYDIPRLCELATHALHQMLNMSTAPLIFETAALSHQTSLQIRALKMMIAAKKMIQQQQQLQQQLQEQETIRTPVAASNLMDPQFQISPTTPTSSINYSQPQRASSIFTTPTRNTYSPPVTPTHKPKEKKKKKAFLEAFGKLSSSIYNHH